MNKSKVLLEKITISLQKDKALNIKSINLLNRSSVADYMIIASGNSSRQVSSMANNLIVRLKEDGFKSRKPEGLSNSDWVLIDAYDIIVHLFRPEVREFYQLEKMWQTPIIKNKNFK